MLGHYLTLRDIILAADLQQLSMQTSALARLGHHVLRRLDKLWWRGLTRVAYRMAVLNLLCLIWLGEFCSASTAEAGLPYHKQPYRQVSIELQGRGVVALGDFSHQNAYPFYTVTQVLSNWLTQASSNGGQLTLALEIDAQMAEVLCKYLDSGDLEPVLEFWLPFNSLDLLEFYGHLRDFRLRIRDLNEGLSASRQVSFRVLGLEPPSPLSATTLSEITLPTMWQAGEVANERDRQIAQNLINHLQANPHDRVLVFYGNGHLPTRKQPTGWAQSLLGSTDEWMTMGSLLKQHLGTNFLSIAQLWLPPEAYHATSPHRALTAQDILIMSSDIPWKHSHRDLTDYDAVIFHGGRGMDEPHLMKYICSRRVLDRAIVRLAFLEQLPQNAFTARHPVFGTTRAALQLTTGQSFERAVQWKAWALTKYYDGFVRMDSEDFATAIQRLCAEPVGKQRNGVLASLGLPPALSTLQRDLTPDQWREVWPKVFPTIRFLQCLGICWVGYPDEKERARRYLVEFSGREFQSPADYLKWYRKNRLFLHY